MRRPGIVSLVWIVLVVGTDFALAGTDRPYTWHLGAALLLYVLIGHWVRVPDWPLHRLNARETIRTSLWAALVVLVGFVLLSVASIAVVRVMGLRFEITPQNVRHPDGLWKFILWAVVWAPVVEELVYRGLVYPHMRALLGRWPAILVNALVFWALHWFYFGGVTLPNHLLGGLVFAWLYDRTRSLVAPMLIHALSNLMLGLGDLFWLHNRALVEGWLGWR